MTQPELCKWLRDNSSGVYRPTADAAVLLEEYREAVNELLSQTGVYGLSDAVTNRLIQIHNQEI